MSTRAEKERQKAQQEKFQAILSNLLKDDDNKYCVDCDAKGPRWASWNLGIFLCIRCAGIHRNLGVHISKVKSVNLDTWSPEQIVMVMEIGNSRARAAYEANLPDNYRRPQTDSALESFIRAKYEAKKYIAKEWIPPKPTVPRELIEDDKDRKKLKNKGSSGSLQLSSVPRNQSSSSITEPKAPVNKPAEPKPVQAKAAAPQQPKAPPPTSSNTADLIGLDAPVSPVHNPNSLLTDLNDFMGGPAPMASSQPNVQTNTNQVTNGSSDINLFGEAAESAEKPGEKVSTKDSIMALYGGQPSQQQFGVPANNYMPMFEGMGEVMNTNNLTPTDCTAMYTMTDTGYYYGHTPDESIFYGGMYMPQQQQQQPQPQQQTTGQMYGMQMNNMQMQQQQGMYGNQMGMMGMPQGNVGMSNMGMGPGGMVMPQQQQGMRMPQGQAGMYGAQQMQQAQFQQMQQQMANMSVGQAGQLQSGMMSNGIPAGQGWGGQTSGHTLSNNLWQ